MGSCFSRHVSEDASVDYDDARPPAPPGGRFVIALDIGSVYSGFAYGDRTKPSVVHTHRAWPGQSELSAQPTKSRRKNIFRVQCKTLTSLMYATNVPSKRGARGASHVDVLTGWGWPAFLDNQKRMAREGFDGKDGSKACYFTEFKQKFAAEQPVGAVEVVSGSNLYGSKSTMIRTQTALEAAAAASRDRAKPSVLGSGTQALDRQMTDYIRELAEFAVSSARRSPGFDEITKFKVQWFLTVPAVWGHQTKERFKRCAQRAGLVYGPFCPRELTDAASPHPLILLLESEVACVSPSSLFHGPGLQMLSKLQDGTDHVVVADIGAGTIHLTTHAKQVQQGVTGLKQVNAEQRVLRLMSVDIMFQEFLKQKLAFSAPLLREYPAEVNTLMGSWEEVKCSFVGSPVDMFITLPPRLAELVPVGTGVRPDTSKPWYGRVQMSRDELQHIFDPEVTRVVTMLRRLITPEVKKLILVGGFSANPYFQRCVRAAFEERLQNEIVVPEEPSTAVLKGAVRVGLSPGVFSHKRNTLRWYGIRVGANEFLTCMENRQQIGHDFCFSQVFLPQQIGQTKMCFSIYTAEVFTRITSMKSPGVAPAAEFLLDISNDPENLDLDREVELRIYFTRSNCIEVTAQRLNFGNDRQLVGLQLPVPSDPSEDTS